MISSHALSLLPTMRSLWTLEMQDRSLDVLFCLSSKRTSCCAISALHLRLLHWSHRQKQ